MKKTVTIGIPVFNEGKNIESLITSLLHQKRVSFVLKQIIVISDGSTDTTSQILTTLAEKEPLLTVIVSKKRLGKPARINQLSNLASTDALVIIDGDIHITKSTVMEELVKPLLTKPFFDLTSGKAVYLPPVSFFEKVMKVGIDMWNEIKKNTTDAEMYTCEGQIRAFSKRLYKLIVFPEYSADDVYPYLFSKKHDFSYCFVPKAVIYYGLPSTAGDFIKQHTRFLHSKAIQSKNFTKDIINAHYVISLQDKMRTYFHYFIRYPLLVSLYTFLLIIPKVEVYFDTQNIGSKWTIISSTKK